MKTNDPRFELIRRCRDGEASAHEREELEGLLRDDGNFRLAYLRYVNVDLALETASVAAPVRAEPLVVRWLAWPTVAAAAAFAMIGIIVGLMMRDGGRTVEAEHVATLALANACRWEGGVNLRQGQRVAATLLRLRSGTAVLRFDGGASLLIRGAVNLELRSRSRAVLRSGDVLVRAEEAAAGFLLETPASMVTDLGTEFAVRVEPSGATEVHVLEGHVSYRKPESAGDELLTAGRAIRYDSPSQAEPRNVSLKATSFAEAVNAAVAPETEDALIATEPFDYSLDVLPLSEATGGAGWQAGWEPAKTWPYPPDPLRPLRFTASAAVIQGRLLDASDGFPAVSRKLASPIRLNRDGVYYLSVRVRWLPGASEVKFMRQARVILRSSADPRRASYVLNMPACLHPQIQRHDCEVFTSRAKVIAGDVQRWVLKIVAHEHGDDELHLRVFQENEAPGPMEPASWHLSLIHERNDTELDQILLDTYLAPDPAAFGDIRLGKTWRSVTADILR